MKQGVRGYVTHHEFGGNKIPIPVQNLVLRNYTHQNNLFFKLSINEYSIPYCYIQLESLLIELPELEGVVMCSIFMLPKNPTKRKAIYQQFLDHDAALHLIFESTVIRTQEDVDLVEEIIAIRKILSTCPQSIPRRLLPTIEQIDYF